MHVLGATLGVPPTTKEYVKDSLAVTSERAVRRCPTEEANVDRHGLSCINDYNHSIQSLSSITGQTLSLWLSVWLRQRVAATSQWWPAAGVRQVLAGSLECSNRLIAWHYAARQKLAWVAASTFLVNSSESRESEVKVVEHWAAARGFHWWILTSLTASGSYLSKAILFYLLLNIGILSLSLPVFYCRSWSWLQSASG